MGAAMIKGLDLVRERKGVYRENGIAFYRPWVVLIDGRGPDRRVGGRGREGEDGEASKSFASSPSASRREHDILGQIVVREPLRLQGLQFRSLFQWLSTR